MNKICIIIIWFGKFPDYFKLWEMSCAYNKNVADFLLITDQHPENLSQNIRITETTIQELQKKMSSSLGFEVCFEKPFKSCDFRPAFGQIFTEELKGYQYWGHCDMDQIFGDLSILSPYLEKFEKIGRSGHLTLYKNNDRMNGLYQQSGALFDYKNVFTSNANYAFDERTGICRIAQKNEVSYKNITKLRADLTVKAKQLVMNDVRNYPEQLFYWEHGHLYRAFYTNGTIHQDEFIYLHFQKKHLPFCCDRIPESFYIGKNGFFEKNGDVTKEDFITYNKKESHIMKVVHSGRYYFHKMISYIKMNSEQRKIWTAQKRIGNEKYE